MKDILKKLLDLKFIYFIVFITLAGWAFFAYFTMNKQIHDQEIYAKIINLSGKQRMLSQKTTLISKRYFETKDEKLKIHLKELIELMYSDHIYIINHLKSKETRDIYFSVENNLDQKVKSYIELLNLFYKTKDFALLKQLEDYSFNLLPKLDEAVSLFEKESDSRTKELLYRERFILIGTLLTLIFEAILIVIPSLRINSQKEKELNELNTSLKFKIQKAIKDNSKKEKLIQQQFHLTQMEEMITNISHQWRQPLSVISTLASSLKLENEVGICTSESVNEKVTIIIDKTTYLSNIINNFYELIKNDELQENINLYQNIQKTLMILEPSLVENEINIEMEFLDEDIFIKGGNSKFSQALLNILNNSRDFLIDKQIKNKFIKIKVYKNENFIIIQIEDNAGGIKEENIKKIFDAYFTTKHKSQGTGLGLYITCEIIKNCFEGTIQAENTQLGVKFIIKIPMHKSFS